MFGFCLCALARSASAHELAIDQVMLWPDPAAGVLRGELTFDPELTRGSEAQPSAEYERKVLDFLESNLRLTLDGEAQRPGFEVRELWTRSGATLGDLIVFSVPLPTGAHELRLFASDSFKALVVSVQMVDVVGRVETTSWLLGRGEWTPAYRLGAGWQEPGWRAGGPDVFWDTVSGDRPTTGDAASELPSGANAAPPTSPALAARFVRLGFEHILPGGIDHVLFVAGLVLGSARRYRHVLISLMLFTLAHTLTLALVSFQIVRLPAGLVEPLIALSIVALGVDNLRRRRVASRRQLARHAVVFGFGLIHGLGFANALAELAFDPAQAVLALFSFNLGVELGQVVVVALIGLVLHLIRERRSLECYATLVGSAVIALSGSFLVLERLAAFFASPPSLSKTESIIHET